MTNSPYARTLYVISRHDGRPNVHTERILWLLSALTDDSTISIVLCKTHTQDKDPEIAHVHDQKCNLGAHCRAPPFMVTFRTYKLIRDQYIHGTEERLKCNIMDVIVKLSVAVESLNPLSHVTAPSPCLQHHIWLVCTTCYSFSLYRQKASYFSSRIASRYDNTETSAGDSPSSSSGPSTFRDTLLHFFLFRITARAFDTRATPTNSFS